MNSRGLGDAGVIKTLGSSLKVSARGFCRSYSFSKLLLLTLSGLSVSFLCRGFIMLVTLLPSNLTMPFWNIIFWTLRDSSDSFSRALAS